MGREDGVAAQAAEVRQSLPVAAESVDDELWSELSTSQDQLTWRIATLPSGVAKVSQAVIHRTAEVQLHIDPYQAWMRCFGAEANIDERCLLELRNLAKATGGSLVIDRAPAKFKAELGAWGDLGSAAGIMSRIKSRLDPNDLLSPGRFAFDD
jgi:hypothetical protein